MYSRVFCKTSLVYWCLFTLAFTCVESETRTRPPTMRCWIACDNLIEDILKDMGVFETSPSVPANGGMVRNFVGQSQTKKPTVCQIRLNLAFQLTLRTDAVK